VIRRDETGLREKYLKVNRKVEQKMGKPRFGWLEDEENDLREPKVSRWRRRKKIDEIWFMS
jgi:hypothetical protein